MQKYSRYDFLKVYHKLKKYCYGHNGFVAGGVFKNLFCDEPFKDIDFFFESQEEFDIADKHFSTNQDYISHYSNERTHAYKNLKDGVVVELIKLFFDTPENTLKRFDFTITKVAYVNKFLTDEKYEELLESLDEGEDVKDYLEESYFVIHDDFFKHLNLKRLVIDDQIPFPTSTFNRMFRYARYGFMPCRETKVKMINALRAMEEFKNEDLTSSMYEGVD